MAALPHGHQPESFWQRHLRRLLLGKLKNGKTEFSYGGQQTFECPHTMFPQYLEKPCWYASRKKDLQIDIDSGDPHNP